MIRKGHLRLLPRPSAKCVPWPYPPSRLDGVELWRDGIAWRLVHVRRGRITELRITGAELRELVEMGRELLERDSEDT